MSIDVYVEHLSIYGCCTFVNLLYFSVMRHSIYMYIYECMYLYVCMYIYLYICMCVGVYGCVIIMKATANILGYLPEYGRISNFWRHCTLISQDMEKSSWYWPENFIATDSLSYYYILPGKKCNQQSCPAMNLVSYRNH